MGTIEAHQAVQDRKLAERLFLRVAHSLGLKAGRFVWEGGKDETEPVRLVGVVGFARGTFKGVWLTDDPNGPAFMTGAAFAVGDRDIPSSAPVPPDQLEQFMRRLLTAFEQRSETICLARRKASQPADTPAMLYGNVKLEVRLTDRCNERCVFCNTADGGENQVPDLETALGYARRAREAGARELVLTGGEPLLVPWVFDLVEAASGLGYLHTTIQTNAVLLDKAEVFERVRKLQPILQVSLHASNPELSGQLTLAPGFWEPKIRGIKKALAAGVLVNLNYVACRQNLSDLEDFVRFVDREFVGFRGALTFSLVAPVGSAWSNRNDIVPTYAKAGPPLLAAMKLGRSLGIDVLLPESCSIPVCLVPEFREFTRHLDDLDVPLAPDRVKWPGCAQCDFDSKCPGVYESYVDLYGDDEFEKIR
jgi:pyruvate-formate lyase-activating enzyme